MYKIRLKDCKKILAGDKCSLREMLHPDKADLCIRYSLAHATVKPGKKTTAHKLKTSEVYYIMKGSGVMYIDNESSSVSKGCTVYIPPRASQCIKNTGKRDLVFLCIVDPAWRKEDEEVMDE